MMNDKKISDKELTDLIQSQLKAFEEKSGVKIQDNNLLGKGGFSTVYFGTKDKRSFAIKLILVNPKDPQREKKNQWARSEMIVTSNLKHKNCIKCMGGFDLEHSKVLVLEQAINKDLAYLTNAFYTQRLFPQINIRKEALPPKDTDRDPSASDSRSGSSISTAPCSFDENFNNNQYKWFFYMSESMIRFFFVQLLAALDYLQKMNFIHKDIKLENLLIMRNFQIKLADFALSAAVPSGGELRLTNAGTSVYMGPEFFNVATKSVLAKDAFKIDYYSAGIVLHKMLTNDFVYKKHKDDPIDVEDLKKKILSAQSGENYVHRYSTSEEVKKLIAKMIDKEIFRRPNLSTIMSDPWIKINEDRIKLLYDVHENDYLKFLLELQKTDFMSKLHDRAKKKFAKCEKNLNNIDYHWKFDNKKENESLKVSKVQFSFKSHRFKYKNIFHSRKV